MNGYLSNIALRGAGLHPMNSMRPRRGIFESGNVTAPLIHSIQERSSDEPYNFQNQAEPTKQVIRDIPSPEKVEEQPAMSDPPDSSEPDSLSDPIVEKMAATTLSSSKNMPGTHQVMRNVETEPLPDGDHAVRPALNPKLSIHSVGTVEPSPQLYEERQLSVQAPQQAEVDGKTQKKETKTSKSPDDSAIPEPPPAKDVTEDVKKYRSKNNNSSADSAADYHKQPYTKNEQDRIKPVSPSTIVQTRISPAEQTSFPKMRSARKTAIQSEAQQTVKVKIGKVEVRAAQTPEPPSAPPSQAPVRSGFADYLSVRNYDFPEY